MKENNESSNSGWIFFAGLATGAVIGYLINSDRGREARQEAANRAHELSEQAKTLAQEKWSNATSAVNNVIEKGKSYASDLSSRVQNKIGAAADTAEKAVDQTEDAFQKGANRAQARLKEVNQNY